jgi:hypothetical protein
MAMRSYDLGCIVNIKVMSFTCFKKVNKDVFVVKHSIEDNDYGVQFYMIKEIVVVTWWEGMKGLQFLPIVQSVRFLIIDEQKVTHEYALNTMQI